jgi:hypothetical protein
MLGGLFSQEVLLDFSNKSLTDLPEGIPSGRQFFPSCGLSSGSWSICIGLFGLFFFRFFFFIDVTNIVARNNQIVAIPASIRLAENLTKLGNRAAAATDCLFPFIFHQIWRTIGCAICPTVFIT